MKSSAMRDLMALTERDDVISLAGGLPDTSTFPPDSYAALMHEVAAESCARALQYGAHRGAGGGQALRSLDVMAAESMCGVDMDEILVTTGGQQVIDLVCKTLIDPGDVIVAEAPTYPGAVPAFCAYQADVVQVEMDRDGMRVDEMEGALDRLEAEGRRPKFIYTVPTFQNPAGVTMSLPRRERLVRIAQRARAAGAGGQPLWAAALRGRAGPDAAGAGRRRVRHLPGHVLEDPVARHPARLGRRAPARAGEDEHRQAGGRPVLVVDDPALRGRVFRHGRWQEYVRSLAEIYRRRRDTMLDALAEHLPAEAEWTHPAGGLFVWATLPDYIDTTDLLARALQEDVAFVPGRAAFLDGRGGSSLRLNFSGVSEDDIREGVRRIGKVVREQVGLYGTLTGSAPPAAQTEAPPEPAPRDERLADVLELPPRPPARGPRRRRRMSRVAVLKGGRSLEREVSLRSGARVEDALERLGHDVVPIDVGGDLVQRLRDAAADVAFVALHGRDGEDGTVQEILELLGRALHRLRGVGVHPLHGQGAGQARDARRRAFPRPTSTPSTRRPSRSWAPPGRPAGDRGAAGVPDRGQARVAGLRPGDQVRAHGVRRPRGAGGGVLLRPRRSCSSATSTGATWRSRCSTRPMGRPRCPWSRRCPRRRTSTTSRRATRSGAREFVCPADSARTTCRRAQRLALEVYRLLGCAGFARVDLMLDRDDRRAVRPGGQRDPGPDRDLAAAPGRRGGRAGLRRADRAHPGDSADAGGSGLAPAAPTSRPPAKSSGVTFSRNSLNFSTTSSVSSTSCSNSIADSAMTSSAAKIGAPARTASASASLGRESISTSRPLSWRVIEA